MPPLFWSCCPWDSPSSAAPVTVYVRGAWNETMLPFMADQAKIFEQRNPDIKINVEFTPSGVDAIQKLRAEFISGQTPDVVQVWKTFFNEFVASDLVTEISDVYTQNGWTPGKTVYFGTRNWCEPIGDARNNAGNVYGVADYLFTSVIFYNTNIFKKLGLKEPTTLDELIAVSKKLKANGIRPMSYVGKSNNIVDVLAKIQVQTAGLQPLLDLNSGKAKLTDPPLLNAVKIFERMVKEGVLDPAFITYDDDMAAAGFAKGEAAMYSMHTALDPVLQNAKKADPTFDYSIIRGIKFVENPKVEVSATFGGCWIIPKASQHVAEAKKVLAFLLGEESAKPNAAKAGRVTQFIAANSLITWPPIKVVTTYQLPKVTAESFYLVDMLPGKVLANLAAGLQELVLGHITAEQVMANAQAVEDDVRATQ